MDTANFEAPLIDRGQAENEFGDAGDHENQPPHCEAAKV